MSHHHLLPTPSAPQDPHNTHIQDIPIPSSSSSSLKRRASSSFDCADDSTSRKRVKEGLDATQLTMETDPTDNELKAFEDMGQELQCGCCAELVYRPLLVMPCQHFFCGSCCVQWVKNNGTNCPACRGMSTHTVPFRALQPIIDSFLRAAPHRARTEREKQQADAIYNSNMRVHIPGPRESSPPPDVNRSAEYAYPCPHCAPNNQYGYQCPVPVIDPSTDISRAWHVDDGVPPGHAHCGNCENLLALRAHETSRCDLCLTMFCGVHIENRCLALPFLEQAPHAMSTYEDLLQTPDLYDAFHGNTVEVDYMLEYMTTQGMSPSHVYSEIIQHIQKQPRGFTPLIEDGMFSDLWNVAPVNDDHPEEPRTKICRMCALEVLLYGLQEWWLRERKKGFVEERVMNRPDCSDGTSCRLQKHDTAHCKEFNHLCSPKPPAAAADETSTSDLEDRPIDTVQTLSSTQPEASSTSPTSTSPTPTSSTPAPIEYSSTSIPIANPSSGSLSFLLNVEPDVTTSTPPRHLDAHLSVESGYLHR